VTDVEDNLARVQKLIESLDHEPPQVLIEGKIVEATDEFSRYIGINWQSSGLQTPIGQSGKNTVNMLPRFSSNPVDAAKTGLFELTIGTLDIFGSLSTALN